MTNLYKITVKLFLLSTLVLTACPGGNRKSAPELKPGVFFQELQQEEERLKSEYGFYTELYSDGRIGYGNVLDPQHLQRLAQIKNQHPNLVKANFLDDIMTFTLNYQNLEFGRDSFEGFDAELYNEYSLKLSKLGQFFVVKRAEFYMGAKGRVENRLSDMGLESENVIDLGNTDINITTLNFNRIQRMDSNQVRYTLMDAKRICEAYNDLSAPHIFSDQISHLNLQPCVGSGSLLDIADGINTTPGSFNIRAVAEQVNQASLPRVRELNQKANNFLKQNSIKLDVSKSRGIKKGLRNKWETDVRNKYINRDPGLIDAAIDNNLYENLYFKKRTLELLIKLLPFANDNRNEQRRTQLAAAEKGLNTVSYRRKLKFKVGTSIVSGPSNVKKTATTPKPKKKKKEDKPKKKKKKADPIKEEKKKEEEKGENEGDDLIELPPAPGGVEDF